MTKLESQIKGQESSLNQERPKFIKLQEEARHTTNKLANAEKEIGPITQVST